MPRVGEIWKYIGQSPVSYGEEYMITELFKAVKLPGGTWHQGVRYVPLRPVENAPNDYVRIDEDFHSCFIFSRDQ